MVRNNADDVKVIKRTATRQPLSASAALLDAVPAAQDEVVNVLEAMRAEGRPVAATTVRALVIAAMERHAPHMLAANGGAFSVSSSCVH
eukprot:363953-Chlamydomonas_euryale.AAC.7